MSQFSDNVHRLVKQRIDSGQAASLEAAEAQLMSLQLVVELGALADSPAHHDALLTVVALARRTFLGGVWVTGALDAPLRSRSPAHRTLREAVVALGGRPEERVTSHSPRISIGVPSHAETSFHVRATFSGWRGGVTPAAGQPLDEQDVMPLAPMLAAALAVGEAYAHVTGDVVAGRREVGMSLWQPSLVDWRSLENAPQLQRLPSRLWLIGLGHLGQAYLWGLGLLPYTAGQLELVLQDYDRATASTESTSVLTDNTMIGLKKTRIAAEWAETRGFMTTVTERRFDARTTPTETEPRVALCGLDNVLGRRALDQVGFDFVVEAGLGSGHRDFRTIVVHTLPGARPAHEIWQFRSPTRGALSNQPAYQQLISAGKIDQCGATSLAGVAVGAPWVGAVASTLVISEVLRLVNDGALNSTISLDLAALDFRIVTPRQPPPAFNPGFVEFLK